MIKDQCNNCMKQMSMTCTHQIIFNGSPCQEYVRKFDLAKHKDKNTQPVEEVQSITTNPVTQPTSSTSEGSFFKSLFSFKGRSRRTAYWCTNIILNLLMAPANLAGDELSTGMAIYVLIILIPHSWILLANYVKRFHDLGRSGWLAIGMIIPIVNILLVIYLAFFKGQEYDNEYGPNPY